MTQRLDPLPTLSLLSRHRSPALFATVVGLVIGLVAAPMVGIVPVSAARADATVNDWTALQSAFTAGGTQTVTLDGDVVAPAGESLALVDGDNVVLDLNGHSLTIGDTTTVPANYRAAIGVPGGATLTISDTARGGQLTAFGGDSSAGIGGASTGTHGGTVGEIIITGGRIDVTGGRLGAGIGGGFLGGAGTILITGGTVVARGLQSGAGIGGGQRGPGTGSVTITGGTITAVGGSGSAGIGGGNRSRGVTTTISGGFVTAEGRTYAAGIGGGYGEEGNGGAVTISGGSIIARGGANAAGIGGGFNGISYGPTSPGTLTVVGTPASGSALNGASGKPNSPRPGGPAPTFTIVDGPRGYFATTGHNGSGGRFVLNFDWTASFDAAGGTPTPAPQLVTRGGLLTEPTAPILEHYDLSGWHANSADGPAWAFASSRSDRDLTLVARWTPATYELNYDFAGGTDDDANPAIYTIESEEFTLTAPHRDSYEFLGWTGPGLSEPTESVTISSGSTGDRSYTAHWAPVEYGLIYDFAGGTDDDANPTHYTIESEEIVLTAPHRDGYVVLGWTGTELTGTTETVTIPTGSTGDRSYTVQWEVDTPTNTVLPTISGGTTLGAQLLATPGSWDLGGLSYAYQWYRGDQPITGADSASYELVTEDLGTTVSVEVTGFRAGDSRYHPSPARSTGMSIPLGTFVPGGGLEISGTPGVGHELAVSDESWLPNTATFSYVWLRDGVPIIDATAASYLLGIADEEALVAVAVTVSVPGYHDFVVTTEPVTVDAEPATTPPAPDQSTLTEDARGGAEAAGDGNTVTLTVPGAGPDPRWVYVYGFSTPTGLGWHRTVGGAVTVDVAGLGAGTHQLAVLTVSGSLTGWASIDIPALAFTGTADLAPLIGLAVLLVLLGGMVAWLRPLRRRSNQ